jgi:hypothetical protein
MRFITTKMKITLATLAIVSCSTLVTAQPGGGRSGGMMSRITAGGTTPDYMLRDLQRFSESLQLNDEQGVIVEQILRDYDESFREASNASQESMRNTFTSMRGNEDDPARQEQQEMRQRARDIREKMDSASELQGEDGMEELQERLSAEMDEIRESMNESRAAQWESPERQSAMEDLGLYVADQLRLKRQMRFEFETDLVAILAEEQLLLWPPLKRMLVRDRLLPKGRLSGETIDVMGLVEQQSFDDETLIVLFPTMNEWDENVTAALQARDDHLVENQGALMATFGSQESSSQSVMKEQARLAETVRQINDDAVSQIASALPSEEGSAFAYIARERAYPRIFRTTRVERAYLGAIELEDLDPEILGSIVELYDALLTDLEYSNDQVLAATRRWESQETIERMNRFASRMSGGESERPESPIRAAEDDRRKIEENYLEQLRMLLTEEQIKELGGLEKREEREDRGRGGWGNRGGRGDRGGSSDGDREAFMKQFDKDGDGELSESEREGIRDHFRNGGGRPGGDRPGGAGGGRGGNTGNSQGGGRTPR